MRRWLAIAAIAIAGTAAAQMLPDRPGSDTEDWFPDRAGMPDWTSDDGFQKDGFTFARLIYGYGDRWTTDAPDSDLNFSYRLQELTTLKTNPHPRAIRATDPELRQFPFLYMVEPAGLRFDEAEAAALRAHLLGGGFLMVDDFWGEGQWSSFYSGIKQVFPDRDFVELPPEHPIFHCVFQVDKAQMQIPNIDLGMESRLTGVTWEQEDAREVHIRAIYDDAGRICVLICHNTDLGDGWEREGFDEWYFREFSEKKAYPLGINIIFYAMTH